LKLNIIKVILDEGHIIKNPRTKISKAMHQTRSPHRLILTGTPIQNNLAEFYSLIDWVTQGRLLGSLSSFAARFSNPITTGQDPKASDAQRKVKR
jgi:SNF2 family DNA or RNA helicase